MEVAGAADVRMMVYAGALRSRLSATKFVFENGGDARVIQSANLDRPGRGGLNMPGVEPAKQFEDTQAGSKRLLGMPSTRK